MTNNHVSIRFYQDSVLFGGARFVEVESGAIVARDGFPGEKFVVVAFDVPQHLFRVYSIPRLRALAQAEQTEGRYTLAYDAYLGRAIDTVPSIIVVVGIDDVLAGVAKALCLACSCMVRVDGHEDRCTQPHDRPHDGQVSYLRRMSWLGDAMHLVDVRSVLLDAAVPDARLQVTAQQYLSNEHMAGMYDHLMSSHGIVPRCLTLGPSVRQRATAFEASYVDVFRLTYLRVNFGLTPQQLRDVFDRVEALFDSTHSFC